MFSNKSAWFSNSVPKTCQTFWIQEGGTIAGWRTADYLFSQDASCPDTLRIFGSKDYLWNQVTVFQSFFLSTCQKRQSVQSVCIGHYVLPPASVQEEVRPVVGRFIWECEDEAQGPFQTQDEFSEGDDSRSTSEPSDTVSSDSEAPLCVHLQEYPARKMPTGYISMDAMPKYSGDLCEIYPECWRCSNCNALHSSKHGLRGQKVQTATNSCSCS